MSGLNHETMTCLMARVLGGEGIKSRTSKLGKFFVNTLAQSILIFKKKGHPIYMVLLQKENI